MRYGFVVSGLLLFFFFGCSGEPEQKSPPVASQKDPASAEVAVVPPPEPTPATPEPVDGPGPDAAEPIALFTAQGSDLEIWQAPRSNTISDHEQGILITSAEENPGSGGSTHGVFVRVSDEFEQAASGNRIRVSITAKRSEENAAETFAIAYSTNEVGNSGWQSFQAGEDFEIFVFKYDVRPMREGKGDFVGVWADVTGSGKGLLVQSLTVEVIEK